MTNVNIQKSGVETSYESQFVTTCGKYDIHSTILLGFEPHLTSLNALIDTNIIDIIVQYLPKGNNFIETPVLYDDHACTGINRPITEFKSVHHNHSLISKLTHGQIAFRFIPIMHLTECTKIDICIGCCVYLLSLILVLLFATHDKSILIATCSIWSGCVYLILRICLQPFRHTEHVLIFDINDNNIYVMNINNNTLFCNNNICCKNECCGKLQNKQKQTLIFIEKLDMFNEQSLKYIERDNEVRIFDKLWFRPYKNQNTHNTHVATMKEFISKINRWHENVFLIKKNKWEDNLRVDDDHDHEQLAIATSKKSYFCNYDTHSNDNFCNSDSSHEYGHEYDNDNCNDKINNDHNSKIKIVRHDGYNYSCNRYDFSKYNYNYNHNTNTSTRKHYYVKKKQNNSDNIMCVTIVRHNHSYNYARVSTVDTDNNFANNSMDHKTIYPFSDKSGQQ